MRWDLLKTILWLRWKLAANQFAKAGAWLRALLVLIAAIAVLSMFGMLAGGVALGALVFSKVSPDVLMLIVDGVVLMFVFIWCIGIVSEIQRSESIDLQRLLHLPVKLKDAFMVNYVASHVSISLMLLIPAMVGVAIGAMIAGRFAYVVILPLVVSCVFAVSSWTYCLRGWLVQLMVNPRRRRSILISLTLAIIVLAQTPNLFFNVYLRGKHGNDMDKAAASTMKSEKVRDLFRLAHYYVPPMWVSFGTAKAGEGNWWPAGAAIVLFSLTGSAGVRRAYRSTLRYYKGESNSKNGKPTGEKKSKVPVKNPLEGDLPLVSGDVAVAAKAFWRSMVRAPEMKMALLGPFIMAVIIGAMFLSREFSGGSRHAAPLIAIGVTLFSMSGVMQIVFNVFGWDREGFRALVLSPIDRGQLLLAKNIALFPLLTLLGLLLYVGVSILMKMNPVFWIGGLFQIVCAAIILFIVGNLISIKLPYRIQIGSLKPTRMPVKNVLVMLGLTLLFPFYMLPVLVGPAIGMIAGFVGSDIAILLNIGVSAVMCLFVIGVYGLSKKHMGKLLQADEGKILQIVTSELE